jgi:hypothetical protein
VQRRRGRWWCQSGSGSGARDGPCTDTHAHARTCSLADAQPDAGPYAYAGADTHTVAYAYAYAGADTHTVADACPHAGADTDSLTRAHAYAHPRPHDELRHGGISGDRRRHIDERIDCVS